MKRTLVLLIALLLILCSCGEKPAGDAAPQSDPAAAANGPAPAEVPAETEPARFTPDVPAADFDGADFLVGGFDPALLPSVLLEFDFDEEPADVVYSAIFRRNRLVESTYQVKIQSDYLGNYDVTPPMLRKAAASGDGTYQLLMLICRDAYPASLEGLSIPYSEIPYLDPSKPWYMHYVNEAMTLKETPVLLYTDMCLNTYLQSVGIEFNKSVTEDLGLEDPYTLVREGRWTHDRFYAMAESAVLDVDGNGEYTASAEGGDRFGVNGELDMFYPSLWIGANSMLVTKSEEDIPVYSAPSDEKLVGILDTLTEKLKIPGLYMDNFDTLGWAESSRIEGLRYFAANGALFHIGAMGHIGQLRDMEADFGILPLPKLDEEQDTYYSRMIDGWLYLVPNAPQDLALVGTMIEALSAETKNLVIPAYFDVALTHKLVRDTDSEEMLRIVFDNINIDLGDTVLFASLRSPLTGEIFNLKGNYTSWLVKKQKEVGSIIDDFLESMEKQS